MMTQWRKSSRSNMIGADCVETARAGRHVLVRDSKNPDGPRIAITPAGFAALLTGIKES